MTNAERDELLIRMSVQLTQIDRKLNRDSNALYGTDENPGTGLIQRVKTIETGARWGLAVASITGAIVGFLINIAVALWKK